MNIIRMPQIGVSNESAILSEWKVTPGSLVKKGEVLFTAETDKATYDVEAEAGGVLLRILYKEGDEIKIGQPIAYVGEPGEPIETGEGDAAPEPGQEEPKAVDSGQAAAPDKQQIQPPVVDAEPGDRIFASPRARLLAVKMGVDLAAVTPTGPENRISEADVLRDAGKKAPMAAVSAEMERSPLPQVPAEKEQPTIPVENAYTDTKLSNMRRVIGRNMMNSLAQSAQLTMFSSFDATAILSLREKFKAHERTQSITLNTLILYAVSRVLKSYPLMNAHLLDGEVLRTFESVNLGFAVDTPRGLYVPKIHGCDRLSLLEIAGAAQLLASKCQDQSITAEEMAGGTFTVSNLGASGLQYFTPVLNVPETGILGVGGKMRSSRPGKNGEEFYDAMGLSVTMDHRAFDGAYGARFLQELCAALEDFELLLV